MGASEEGELNTVICTPPSSHCSARRFDASMFVTWESSWYRMPVSASSTARHNLSKSSGGYTWSGFFLQGIINSSLTYTFEELLRAIMLEQDATRRVLVRKGLLTNEEVLGEGEESS